MEKVDGVRGTSLCFTTVVGLMNVRSIEFSITVGTEVGKFEPYSLCFDPIDWLLEEVEVVTVFDILKVFLFLSGRVVTGIWMLTSKKDFSLTACLDSG